MRGLPSVGTRGWKDSEGLFRVVRRGCGRGSAVRSGFRTGFGRRECGGAAERVHRERWCLRIHQARKLDQSFAVLMLELLVGDEIQAGGRDGGWRLPESGASWRALEHVSPPLLVDESE